MIRRPPRSTPKPSSAASDVYKRQLLHQGKQGKRANYDLVQRMPQGFRYYFGVTDDGIHGPWKQLVGQDEE